MSFKVQGTRLQHAEELVGSFLGSVHRHFFHTILLLRSMPLILPDKTATPHIPEIPTL